jgi:hypothetical protein
MLSNYVTSLVRTVVPAVVGTLLAVLAKRGINVDEAEINAWLIPLVISGYYAAARFVEIKIPKVGWLLGVPKAPGYSPASVPPARPSPGSNPDL